MWVILNRRFVVVFASLLVLTSIAVFPAPNPDDGITVFYLLCEPFGAYGLNLWNNFERLGWDVTSAGTHPVVERCNAMTTDVTVDVVIDSSVDLGDFDVLAVSPTKGTHRVVANPAADLRENEAALELVRKAHADAMTLYAGCSSFLVFADAGVLEGRRAVHSPKYVSACKEAAAECFYGGKTQPPIVDENVITGTNQRYFALEIPEAIARSLDRLDAFEPALDLLRLTDLPVSSTSIDSEGAVVAANAHGTDVSDLAYDVCSFDDGFVVAGQTYGGEGGNADALIMRFGPDAKPLWARTLGGPGRDTAYSACATSDGAIAIAGLTTSAGAGGEDVLIAKISAEGQVIWKRTYGADDSDAAFSLCEASNGDLLVTGITHTSETEFSAVYLLRLDQEGEEVWSTYYDGALHERGHSVVEKEDGTVLVAGGSSSLRRQNYDMILASFSQEGDLQDVQACAVGVYDIAEDVILTESGDAVVVGFGDDGNSAGDPNQVLISRVDAEGKVLWNQRCGKRASFDYGQGIVELESGALVVCGASTGDETGVNDVLFLTVSESGDELWQQRFGEDAESEWANALCEIADGRIVSVGWTRSFGAGSHDLLVMVLDPTPIQ